MIATTSIEERALLELSKGDYTPDEIATRIGESVLAVRPIMTVLRQLKKIYRTGARKPNESGKAAFVLTLNPALMAVADSEVCPVKLKMVQQAQRLNFDRVAAATLLEGEMDSETLTTALDIVYGNQT